MKLFDNDFYTNKYQKIHDAIAAACILGVIPFACVIVPLLVNIICK